MDKMLEEYEHSNAVETFKEIVEEINSCNVRIPSIDRITTFNNKEVIINFYDKFFTIYEVLTFEAEGDTKSNLAAVALGRYEGKGQLTMVDFRYLTKNHQDLIDLFKKGIESFLGLVDRNRMEELPPTELHEGGTKLAYEEIVEKVIATYMLAEPQTIH